MEFARWALAPAKWAYDGARSVFERYLYFVGVREENAALTRELNAARQELAVNREKAAEAERLATLLELRPPIGWSRAGARIISHRLGPNAALETILIDRGGLDGLAVNTPVATPEGVVGRVLRVSPSAANVLLITDPNSRIPVTSQKNRTQGILRGEGPNRELTVEYVPLGSPIEENEILVTSGLEGIFPKGLPAARVTRVARAEALFQTVFAAPLFDPGRLEEVCLLKRRPGVPETSPRREEEAASPAPPAVGDADATAPHGAVHGPPGAKPAATGAASTEGAAAAKPAPAAGARPTREVPASSGRAGQESKPAASKPAASPGEAVKPVAKPQAKPDSKPAPKPGAGPEAKPGRGPLPPSGDATGSLPAKGRDRVQERGVFA